MTRLSRDASLGNLFRRRGSKSPLPSKGILRRVVRLYHTVVFPNFCKGSAIGQRAVGCRVNMGVRHLCRLLARRVRTKLYFTALTRGRGFGSTYHRGTVRLTDTFVKQLPRLHQVLTASIRTTCGKSPTTRSCNRVVDYCPVVGTLANCHVTRRLLLLKIPLVPHVVARVTRSRANVSVRPTTQVKRRFAVSRKAKMIVNTAYVVKGGIGLCRKIALNTGDFPLSRGKGPVGNVTHRPVLRSSIVICTGSAVLKHVAVKGNTAVNNGV